MDGLPPFRGERQTRQLKTQSKTLVFTKRAQRASPSLEGRGGYMLDMIREDIILDILLLLIINNNKNNNFLFIVL